MAVARASATSLTRDARRSRAPRLVRAAVYAVSGLAIAFSATLHEQLVFDRSVVAGSLILIALSWLFELFSATERRWLALAHAAIAVAAGIGAALAPESGSLALVLAGWALLSAVLAPVQRRSASVRSSVVATTAVLVLLAAVLVLTRDDVVAVTGFFGAYAVLAAVFLAISVFDPVAPEAPDHTESAS